MKPRFDETNKSALSGANWRTKEMNQNIKFGESIHIATVIILQPHNVPSLCSSDESSTIFKANDPTELMVQVDRFIDDINESETRHGYPKIAYEIHFHTITNPIITYYNEA